MFSPWILCESGEISKPQSKEAMGMKKSFWRKTVVSTIMVASLSLTNVGAILASEWNNEVTSEWGMQSLRNSALFAAEDQKKESY